MHCVPSISDMTRLTPIWDAQQSSFLESRDNLYLLFLTQVIPVHSFLSQSDLPAFTSHCLCSLELHMGRSSAW